MWKFSGKYSGEAREYVLAKRKRVGAIEALVCSSVIVVLFVGLALGFEVLGYNDDSRLFVLVLGVVLGLIILSNIVLILYYCRNVKSDVTITNSCVQAYHDLTKTSVSFYNIKTIDFYDDFIVIDGTRNKVGFVLQKELLTHGEWEELEAFLKRVEASLHTDQPVYEVKEPKADFFEATVKSKRVVRRFVGSISMKRAEYDYLVTFVLLNGEEIECKIGQELYENAQPGESGTLALIDGEFFDFGQGEEIEGN